MQQPGLDPAVLSLGEHVEEDGEQVGGAVRLFSQRKSRTDRRHFVSDIRRFIGENIFPVVLLGQQPCPDIGVSDYSARARLRRAC